MTIVSRMLERSCLPRGGVVRLAPRPTDRLGLPGRATAIWQAALDAIAPMGYEDEAGFHYGLPSHAPGTEHAHGP